MAYDELADDLAARGIATTEATYGGGGDGRPSWTVRFERLAEGQVEGYRVRGTEGLYAAGICRTGPLGYPAAARDGAALAARIAADLGSTTRPAVDQVT